jgi:hypothetical protein
MSQSPLIAHGVSPAVQHLLDEIADEQAITLTRLKAYVSVQPAPDHRVAAYVRKRGLSVALEAEDAAKIAATDDAFALEPDVGPTRYLVVADTVLTRPTTRERALDALRLALDRSRRIGLESHTKGSKGVAQKPPSTCVVCHLQLPVTGICDDHG